MRGCETLFAGLCVCSTGLEPPVMEQVRKIVLACGGDFQDNMDAAKTTHLIAGAVGSDKHRTAVAHELPVASPRWVFESYRAHTLLDVNEFKLGLLEGLVVCTTGLPMDEKESVAELVTSNGAQYEPQLELSYTSLLIALRPEGAKYEAAVANEIPVVHVAWLYACLEKQMLEELDDYALLPELEQANQQPTHIAAKLQQDAQELVASLPQIVKKYHRNQRQKDEGADVTDHSYELEEESDDDWTDLFDGCVLYLLGFSPQMKTLLQCLIRTGLGTIYDTVVVRQVTHVIVSASLSDRQMLETIQTRVANANAEGEICFVSCRWLLDCIRCEHLEPEELYPVEFDVHPEFVADDNAPPPGDMGTLRRPIEPMQLEEEVNHSTLMLSEDLLQDGDGESVINEMKAALIPESKKKTKLFAGDAFLLLCRDPEDKHFVKHLLKRLRNCSGDTEALAISAGDFPSVDPGQFAFVTYAVMCCGAVVDEQAALVMQQRIHEIQLKQSDDGNNEGETDVRNEVDEMPQKRTRYNESPNTKKPRRRTLRFVSDLWVNCCLATGDRLPYDSHELFATTIQQPRPLFRTALPLPAFRDVLASTTVYMDQDRLVTVELLKLAGAKVTNKLSKRNTHLICKASYGMKYEKAIEWGLSVVTARWVVDSLLHGERLDEASPEFQVVASNQPSRLVALESQETVLSTTSQRPTTA